MAIKSDGVGEDCDVWDILRFNMYHYQPFINYDLY